MTAFSSASRLGGVFAALACLCAVSAPAEAAPTAKQDVLCQQMLDKAAGPWPQRQLNQCTPWLKQRGREIDGTLQQCKAAHANDDNLDACVIQEEAASRFWESEEQLEAQNANHVVTPLPNPILPPAEKPLEDPGAGTHLAQ